MKQFVSHKLKFFEMYPVRENKIEEIKDFIKQNLDISFSLDCREDVHFKKNLLQHFVSVVPKDNNHFYKIVLNYMIQSENSCPGSGKIFLEKFCNSFSSVSNIFTKDDLISFLRSKSYSKDIFSILLECLNLLDSSSKITIKKSSSKNLYIEYVDSFSFSCYSLLKVQNFEIKSPKIVCIDGYIETVSEIHHLLTELSEKSIPAILFCRGMSEDVLYTIKTNNDRKTLQVYPCSVHFDLENANTLVDLAVISGCDVVSSLKGDLISSINFSSLGSVEKINLSQNNILIKSSKTERLKRHLDSLKEKIKERPEISEILSKRLKSLNSSYLEVSIPDGLDYYYKLKQLDEGIRIISSYMNNTYTPERTADFYLKSINQYLNDLEVIESEI